MRTYQIKIHVTTTHHGYHYLEVEAESEADARNRLEDAELVDEKFYESEESDYRDCDIDEVYEV